MSTILVLGAGMVARPLVRYLLDQEGFQVKVASRTVSKAEAVIESHPDGEAMTFDATKEMADLGGLVKEADLTVSLLPFAHHVDVASHCIDQGKPMVTTSYLSEPMKALDKKAKDAGIIILNEIGLDPGIDHMSAMKIIHDIQGSGGEVTDFSSYCGALPSPKAGINPFGYKFSWSPRGVLLASRNPARFIKDGQELAVGGENLFEHYTLLDIDGLGVFEQYPNRDSIPYLETYGIQSARTMYRATLRNLGWCETMRKIVDLDLLNDEARPDLDGKSFEEVLRGCLGCSSDQDIEEAVAEKLGVDTYATVLKRLKWLGLLGREEIPAGSGSLLDALVAQMLKKISLEPGERDMVVMHHDFKARFESRSKEAHIMSTFVDYGDPDGDSSVAKTVGLPAAIGVKLILQGKIDVRGVQVPVIKSIYEPVLAELENVGVTFKETRIDHSL